MSEAQAYASQTRDLLTGILEATGDLVAAQDCNLRYLVFNRAYREEFQRIFGRDIEIGSSVIEAIAHLPEDQKKAGELWARAVRGEEFTITTEFGDPSRQRRFYDLRCGPIRDPQGKIMGVAHMARDVTDRVRAEVALRQSEERYRVAAEELQTIMDAAPGGIFVAHDPECRLITGNAPAYEAFGVPPGGNISATASEPEELPWFRAYRQGREIKGEELPMQVAAATGSVVRDAELEVVHRDGTRRTLLVTAAPLYAPDRKVRGAVGAIVDITARKRTEAALRESEEKFRAVFERAAIGMGRVSFADAHWIDVNDAFCRMLGYSREEMRATPWPEITHPEDLDLDLIPFRRMAAGELDTYTIEKRFIHKQGHHVWARLTLSLVRNRDGRPDYEIAIIEDISERKQAELALRRAKESLALANQNLDQKVMERTVKLENTVGELEAFSYSLVHDLRAPLRAMQVYASVLEDESIGGLAPEGVEHLRRIRLAADRMDKLITDSLNYSRLLREELPMGPVNVGKLLRGMVQTYPNFQAPAVDIQLEIGELLVWGNEAALTQVFSNLLGNAIKFVAPGVKPRVRIWAREPVARPVSSSCQTTSPGECQNRTEPRVLIVVEDNGIGIPKEGHEKIFRMFHRMHRVEEYPGTGIGLAIVRKSLERIGGQVCLDSELGRGSRFYVELRRVTENGAPQSAEEQHG